MNVPANPNVVVTEPGLRWGILGAANIAQKAMIPAIRAQGGQVVAIGASSLERARRFASANEIPDAHEGYQAVIDRDDLDAIYVPLANGLHYRWAMACGHAGRHCLVEKPMALTIDEAVRLREVFGQTQCRLMEAFMWRHHPQTIKILEDVNAGEVGRLLRIHAMFSFNQTDVGNYRRCEDQGGGALWDVGCYCVNAMRLYFDDEPQMAGARRAPMSLNSKVDMTTVGWLDFGEGRMGTFTCSFGSVFTQRMTLVGDSAAIDIGRPFIGTPAASHIKVSTQLHTSDLDIPEIGSYIAMVSHFSRAIVDPAMALMPGEDGLDQARAMAALVASADAGGAPFDLKN